MILDDPIMASSSTSPAKTLETVTSERPMLRRRRGPRCQLCKRQHQKCRFTHNHEVCDRCLDLGYECRPLAGTERRPTPPVRAPRAKRGSSIFKCDACRQHHQKCEPEDRVWPARCVRCVKQKQPCGPPLDALGRDIPYVRSGNGDGGGDAAGRRGGGSVESWPSPRTLVDRTQQQAPLPFPAPPSTAHSGSSLGASEHARPPMVWQGRVVEEEAPPLPSGMVPGETIRRMEDEFHDVLGQLEKRHARELKAQRDRYEEELGVQRDRYEQRLDDLIRIMKNMGQN